MRRVYPPAAYKRVAQLLQEHIEAGLYDTAKKLPTVAELAELHGVTSSTSFAAFKLLCQQGVITGRRGDGYYVKY